jgi:hypothetical protein
MNMEDAKRHQRTSKTFLEVLTFQIYEANLLNCQTNTAVLQGYSLQIKTGL